MTDGPGADPPPPGGQNPPPPPGGYGPPPPGGYGAPPPGGYGYPYPPARRTESNAIAALVLAILSFVVCPVIPAIVALFLANSAKANIDASGGTLEGESMVTAARIIAWVNLGLAALGVLAVVSIFAIGGAVSLGL